MWRFKKRTPEPTYQTNYTRDDGLRLNSDNELLRLPEAVLYDYERALALATAAKKLAKRALDGANKALDEASTDPRDPYSNLTGPAQRVYEQIDRLSQNILAELVIPEADPAVQRAVDAFVDIQPLDAGTIELSK